jgi:hypothetical protein
MAQYCINIPDEHLDRVISAVANQYRYQLTVDNPDFDLEQPEDETNPKTIPNPQTMGGFVNEVVRNFLIENVKAWESKQAAEAARIAVLDAIDINITDPS